MPQQLVLRMMARFHNMMLVRCMLLTTIFSTSTYSFSTLPASIMQSKNRLSCCSSGNVLGRIRMAGKAAPTNSGEKELLKPVTSPFPLWDENFLQSFGLLDPDRAKVADLPLLAQVLVLHAKKYIETCPHLSVYISQAVLTKKAPSNPTWLICVCCVNCCYTGHLRAAKRLPATASCVLPAVWRHLQSLSRPQGFPDRLGSGHRQACHGGKSHEIRQGHLG